MIFLFYLKKYRGSRNNSSPLAGWSNHPQAMNISISMGYHQQKLDNRQQLIQTPVIRQQARTYPLVMKVQTILLYHSKKKKKRIGKENLEIILKGNAAIENIVKKKQARRLPTCTLNMKGFSPICQLPCLICWNSYLVIPSILALCNAVHICPHCSLWCR